MNDRLADRIMGMAAEFENGAIGVGSMNDEERHEYVTHRDNLALGIRESVLALNGTAEEVKFGIVLATMLYLGAAKDAFECGLRHGYEMGSYEAYQHQMEHIAACVQDYTMALGQMKEVAK